MHSTFLLRGSRHLVIAEEINRLRRFHQTKIQPRRFVHVCGINRQRATVRIGQRIRFHRIKLLLQIKRVVFASIHGVDFVALRNPPANINIIWVVCDNSTFAILCGWRHGVSTSRAICSYWFRIACRQTTTWHIYFVFLLCGRVNASNHSIQFINRSARPLNLLSWCNRRHGKQVINLTLNLCLLPFKVRRHSAFFWLFGRLDFGIRIPD